MNAPKAPRVPVDAKLVALAKEYPDRWLRSACHIVPEDITQGSKVLLTPTAIQGRVIPHLLRNRFSYVVKHRQAKLSTLCLLLMLNRVMYTPHVKGRLYANDEDTTKILFERMKFAYDNMPKNVRIDAQNVSLEAFRWKNGADLLALTGGGDTPGIGQSPDNFVLSEFGEYKRQDLFNMHFFPSVVKRPGAWGVIEMTPGPFGSVSHEMWLASLEGTGWLAPLFLEWFTDPTCVAPVPKGFHPDLEELRLVEQYPLLTPEHLQFRRNMLTGVFSKTGDAGFRSKYPFHPHDGWVVTAGSPSMPKEPIEKLLKSAEKSPSYTDLTFREPESGHFYVALADPNSYGRAGDTASLKIFDRATKEEVFAWHGREMPDLFAGRAIKCAKKYNEAILVVESNKAEMIAACRALGYKNLFYDDPDHPGWRATETTKAEAVEAMVEMLRDEEIGLRCQSTLHQLLIWDGNTRVRVRDGKDRHHFDQVTTVYMAAWFFRRRPLSTRSYQKPKPRPKAGPSIVDGAPTANALMQHLRMLDARKRPPGVIGFL